jgi:uncharacterized damage-inducible protein DinB
MSTSPQPDRRFPIGPYQRPAAITAADRARWLAEVAEAPARLRAAVAGLTPAQLETPYREGGWTVRQVVHHLPDSHLNAYIRFKWALTEDSPAIKAYLEDRWAQTPEVASTPIEVSLALLEALHTRWTALMRAMSADDWARTFQHPEYGARRLEEILPLYAWHGQHHVAHITELRRRMGW